MTDPIQMVTIFRSAEGDAADEAEQVCDLLVESGLTAVVADDTEPGVVAGSWEVRVPPDQAAQADQILNAASQEVGEEVIGDPSEELDLIPLFEEGTDLSEMEAMNIKGLLEANGIAVVIIGTSTMPNLPFEIRVPQDQLEQAEQILADAAAAAEAQPEA